MARVTLSKPAELCVFFTCLRFLCAVAASSDTGVFLNNVTYRAGDTAVLGCTTAAQIHAVTEVAVEWTRTDLTESYVLFFRDARLDSTLQEPSFENRVGLADPELKDGNLSMILRDVRRNDSGTYQCHFMGATSRRRRAVMNTKPLSSVHLSVTGEDTGSETASQTEKGGDSRDNEEPRDRMRPGLIFLVVALTLVLSVFAFRRFQNRRQDKARKENTHLSEPLSALPSV